MTSSKPEKLSVTFIPPATATQPIEGRKYTLTHSDITAELFLDIGYVFNYKKVNPEMRDEVLAEWARTKAGSLHLIGKAYIDDGEFNKEEARRRFNIFNKEMGTALKGMMYGDIVFLRNYPHLLDVAIYIYFESSYPEFSRYHYYGTPRHYLHELFGSY